MKPSPKPKDPETLIKDHSMFAGEIAGPWQSLNPFRESIAIGLYDAGARNFEKD